MTHAPLPEGLTPLVDAEAMRATDRWAITRMGIPGPDLMEAAGTALADAVVELVADGPVAIVCGAGNNGGDGYVAARRLRALGREVRVLTTVDRERLQGDAEAARDRYDGPVEPWTDGALRSAAVIVDAVLGTGATGAPRGVARAAIAAMQAAAEGPDAIPVVACDVPSGVDASTGETNGPAVRAAHTVTFHAAPPGLWIAPGKQHAGRVVVADIGIPARSAADGEQSDPWCGLLTADLLDALPTRATDGTKFRSGHVVAVGGSPGMTGAPCLTAHGAMRAGAGYVTIATATTIEALVAARAPVECLSAALPAGDDGGVGAEATDAILELLDRHAGTLVVGPGLGRGPGRQGLLRALGGRVTGPLVVDADGLAAVAGAPEALRSTAHPQRPTVLTPHAGELARLLGVDTKAVAAQRLASARQAAERADAVVVLKGDDSLVVAPDGRVAVSPGGAPGLATAGTGDVLSGVIGALLARGVEPFVAAAAGVWLHLQAGRLVSDRYGVDGVMAGDVADHVALARRRHEAPTQ